ncbi:MAG: ribose-phosphate diphosphokinase [bacterium]
MAKIILSGSSNYPLAKSIAKRNKLQLAEVEISHFANQEKRIHILTDLKDQDVMIVQSTCGKPDEFLIETLLLKDAATRMQPRSISLVIPWLAYSPQDKVFRTGEALSSEVVVKMLELIGFDKIYVFDLHSEHVLKKFTQAIDNLTTMPLYIQYFKKHIKDKESWVAVAVDKGSKPRASAFAKALGLELVEFDKIRDLNTGEVTFLHLHGSVAGKKIITFDDYVSTGQTLIKSVEFLKALGAKQYYFCVTHVIVESTLSLIEDSDIDKVIITNTIDYPGITEYQKIEVLDIAELIPV